jgi:hypothetical protein
MKTLLLFSLLALTAAAQESLDFRVTSSFPKYVTADLEFRDAAGRLWPQFFYGKPADETGSIRFDPAQPAAGFTLRCDQQAQNQGDQSRRVLGALPGPLAPVLSITTMGPLTAAPKVKGSKATHTAELGGTLEIAGRKLPVKAVTGFWRHDGKGDEKHPALMLEGRFSVPGAQLGLKDVASVEARFGLTAYPPEAAAKK